jgi:hypothetical protein
MTILDDTDVAPTAAAPEPLLAWGLAGDEPEPGTPRRSWPTALTGGAALLLVGGAAAAAILGLFSSQQTRPQTAVITTPPPPTVTVQAPASAVPPVTVTQTPPVATAAPLPSALPPASVPAPVSADDRFISWLAADGIIPEDRGGTLHNAHTICPAFKEGDPRSEIVKVTGINTGLPTFAAADFVSIAVNTFCPEYVGRLVG